MKFDFEEHVSSESELSEFSFEDINEIDKLVVVHGNVACSVTVDPVPPENDANLTNCPITLNDIKSCIPDTLVTNEQKLVSDKINLLLEKHETELRIFVTKLFKKISAIYEQVCGGSTADKKIDSKVWTNYFGELYKYSNSTEYHSHVETCFQRKAESDDFVVFSKIFDFVSHFILESKSSQMKASEEQPQIPNVYSSDNAGLGKLRYIAGRCVAKCKYHYMEMGRNNMYKPKKQSVVTASFLKVKIMDHFTATYSELSESSVYKDTLEETRRKQNITQGLTDIKDDVLDFFIDIDQNRIKYQNEKMFHIHGSKIINFIHEKLFNSEIIF